MSEFKARPNFSHANLGENSYLNHPFPLFTIHQPPPQKKSFKKFLGETNRKYIPSKYGDIVMKQHNG